MVQLHLWIASHMSGVHPSLQARNCANWCIGGSGVTRRTWATKSWEPSRSGWSRKRGWQRWQEGGSDASRGSRWVVVRRTAHILFECHATRLGSCGCMFGDYAVGASNTSHVGFPNGGQWAGRVWESKHDGAGRPVVRSHLPGDHLNYQAFCAHNVWDGRISRRLWNGVVAASAKGRPATWHRVLGLCAAMALFVKREPDVGIFQQRCHGFYSTPNGRATRTVQRVRSPEQWLLAPPLQYLILGKSGLAPRERGALKKVFVGSLCAGERLHEKGKTDRAECRACGPDMNTSGPQSFEMTALMSVSTRWRSH